MSGIIWWWQWHSQIHKPKTRTKTNTKIKCFKGLMYVIFLLFRKSLGSRILNILLAIIDNDTLKDKNKVFQRPKVRYIFQKHGFQGYQYNISLSKVFHKKLFSKHCSPKVSWTQALNIFPGWFFFIFIGLLFDLGSRYICILPIC